VRVALVVASGLCAATVAAPPLLRAAQEGPFLEFSSPELEAQIDADFFDQVRERLVTAGRLEDDYFYRERRTELNTNPFGRRLGTGDVELYEVYPSQDRGPDYRRLVAENGVPVSDEDLAKQDREHAARVREARRREAEDAAELARLSPEELAKREREREERAAERAERQREQTEDILGAIRVTVDRRESFEGRPAIVVTFGPRPGADPQTRRGDIASKFAGTAWIDEETREVRYVEATSVDSISFGLGLAARISEGATASLLREEVDDGVWMPTHVTLEGGGRAMLFLRGLSIDYEVEWFDYTPADQVPVPGLPDAPGS